MLQQKMLRQLGISSPDELFDEIPEEARIDSLQLPKPLSERELIEHIDEMLSENRSMADMPSFLGGGVYRHFIPSVVNEILSRSEFYTSYTPYQAEASQGMLQALFEYQCYMSELTGMDAVNSSMYDWSTALGEAALMAHRMSGGKRILVARSTSPQRRDVLRTYLKGIETEIVEVAFDGDSGNLDLGDLREKLSDDTFALYFENPNFFGVIEEEVEEISAILDDKPMIVGVNPLSLAIMRPPAEYGADIVIGEGHHLGTGPNFGGPLLGIFGCRREHIRKMPGRIVGATVDNEGRQAFCMTLQTREQHIRRDKATSNICTNEALMALAACAYLASVGRTGMVDLAKENIRKARELSEAISGIDGFSSPLFDAFHFNEFVVRAPVSIKEILNKSLDRGVLCGIPLINDFPELGESMLLTVSELNGEEDFEALLNSLEASR